MVHMVRDMWRLWRVSEHTKISTISKFRSKRIKAINGFFIARWCRSTLALKEGLFDEITLLGTKSIVYFLLLRVNHVP